MTLSNELLTVAQELGTILGKHPSVQAYFAAKDMAETNPAIVEMEQKLEKMYRELSERENAGETLSRLELNTYYSQKYQVASNPIVSERENQLEAVKIALARVSNELSSQLGMDYIELVLT